LNFLYGRIVYICRCRTTLHLALKKFRGFIFLLLSCLFVSAVTAQSTLRGSKQMTNAFTFNIPQYFVNEINLGYEHFLSENKSLEFNAGIIYRNEFLLDASSDWVNSQYFREHGFAARAYYKTYKKANEKNNNKTFYSFGINYQYLYFDNEWIETGKTYTLDSMVITEPQHPFKGPKTGDEQILMNRFRNRIGVQLLLGNDIPMGNHSSLEIYYGLGLRGIFSRRNDIARITTVNGVEYYQDLNHTDTQFYIRPTIHAGVKLKLGW